MVSWFHAWRLWYNFENVLQKFSCMLVRNRNISKEDPWNWEWIVYIWIERYERIGVWLWNFLCLQNTPFFFNAKFWLIFGSLLLFIFFFNFLWVWNTWNNSNNKIKHEFFNNFSNVITKCDNICNMKYNSKLNGKKNWK